MNCLRRYFWIAGLSAMLGCGLFPKGDSNAARTAQNDRIPAADLAARNPRTTQNGVLAGQVIDDVNQRRGGVAITVQSLDGGDTKQALSNDQGYFTIQGLQQGKKYKLVANAKSGNLQLSGATEATTPNVVVLIKLSESRQEAGGKPTALSGSVGGLHSSIADPSGQTRESTGQFSANPNPASTGRGDRLGPANDLNQPPSNSTPPGNARLGRPVTTDPNTSPSSAPSRPEYITQTTPLPKSDPPTYLEVPGPGPNRAEPTPRRSDAAVADGRYFNHPLLDLDQRPTTLATYRGQLTLVDVWGTWCFPCVRALPELEALRRRYAEKGLVVLGIAVRGQNETGDVKTRVEAIRFITEKNGVLYPILMEQEAQPIQGVFQIKMVPTLILLDEAGREIWRGEGSSDQTRRQLEQELQRRLK